MGNLGFGEIMAILLVVLILFGAKRLPEMGASLGKGIREFKRSISGIADDVNTLPDDRSAASRQIDAATPQGTATQPAGEPKRLSQ
jgi:sec-independent protein translocase protein TatA